MKAKAKKDTNYEKSHGLDKMPQKKEVMPMYEQSDWYGLYGKRWSKDILVEEAFAHP